MVNRQIAPCVTVFDAWGFNMLQFRFSCIWWRRPVRVSDRDRDYNNDWLGSNKPPGTIDVHSGNVWTDATAPSRF